MSMEKIQKYINVVANLLKMLGIAIAEANGAKSRILCFSSPSDVVEALSKMGFIKEKANSFQKDNIKVTLKNVLIDGKTGALLNFSIEL